MCRRTRHISLVSGLWWESSCTAFMQFITCAFTFSFGSSFRRVVVRNYGLCIIYVALLALLSCVLLLPPSRLTALWHVASEAYNSPGTTSPVWQAYQVPLTPTPFCSCPVRCCPAPSTNVMGACGKRDTNCVNSLGFPLSAAVMALASRAYSICEGVPPLYVSQDVAHHHACSAGTARIRRVLRWPA